MAYTILKGSTLIVEYGSEKYELLISSFEAEQVYQEASQKVQTIHNSELLSREYIEKEGNSSFSFSFNLTSDGTSDSFVFDWFGFPQATGQSYTINTKRDASKYKEATLYLRDATGSTTVLQKAILESITLSFSRAKVFSLTLSGTGGKLLFSQPNITHTKTQLGKSFIGGQPITATMDAIGVPHVSTCSLAFNKGITWIDTKSLFDSEDYIASTYSVESLSAAGTIEAYKSEAAQKSFYQKTFKIQIGGFSIELPNANVTERLGVATVFMKFYDFNLNPSNTTGLISF